ncbi:MAG: glycosyltransferase family 4 protein [Pseudomonadota bacterium]
MTQSPDKPVIIQIIPALGAGGAEQGCIDMAAGIVKAGGRAIVISAGGPRVAELARTGATHITLPVNSKNPLIMWRNIGRIRRIIRQYQAHIVHVRSRAPAWSALKACVGTSARFMTTCHAPYNTQNKFKHFYNSGIARGARVIAISAFVADYLRQGYDVGDDVIRIIARGVNLTRFQAGSVSTERLSKLMQAWRVPDGATVILLPGRLTRWKGQTVLIQAMAKLKRPDIFAVIVGDDQGRAAYRAELEQLITEKGLDGHVRIVPHCDDMPAAYTLAAMAISTSIEPEGFGRIPVEAMAMGKPIIATAIGGAKETIIDGETGWLIPPDDPAALARAIQKVMKLSHSAREELAVRTVAHVAAHFSKEQMIDKTLNVYEELLPRR